MAVALVAVSGLAGPPKAHAELAPGAHGSQAPLAPGAPLELDGVTLEGETQGRRAPVDPGRLRLSALVLLHLADGFGAGAELRAGSMGLRASLGYEPLLFVVDDDPKDQTLGAFEFSNSAQFNLDALLMSRSEIGASLGFRYNTLLGHGVAVAYQSMFELWQQRFSFSIPLMYFPGATSRVREEFGVPSQSGINFPFGPGIQYGIGVAWVL